jgi:trans-aconitate 2-methyltransferase
MGLMYQWNPGDYERNSSIQEKAAKAILARLELTGNEHILDIGCGDGKVTMKMAARVPQGRVLGIDSSLDMINFARKKFPSSQYSNLGFELGDALNLAYNQEFDLVTSFACLHWVKDHLAILRGVRRSLKPRGKMIIQCGGKSSGDDLVTLAREAIRSARWSKYFRGFSNPYGTYGPEEYHAWLDQAGLEELNVELMTKDLIMHGKAELDGFIRTTWLPITERIPVEMRQQFISEISDRHLELHPIEDGLVSIKMAVLEVEARKLDL